MIKAAGSRTGILEQQILKLAGAGTKLESYFKSLGETGTASLTGYIGYLVKAQGKTIALKAATFALSTAISVGLSMLASLAVNKIVELANAAKEAREAAADAASDARALQSSLADLTQQYEKLYQAKDGQWDTDALASVRDIQKQIVDLVGDQSDGIDLVNGKLEDQRKLIRGINVENANNWIRDNRGAIKKATDYIERDNRGGLVPGSGYGEGFVGLNSGAYLVADSQIRKWLHDNLSDYGFSSLLPNSMFEDFAYSITGTADELIDAYTKLYNDLSEYAQSAGVNAEDVLIDISNRIHSISDDAYVENRQIYDSWLQNEAIIQQSNGQYSDKLLTGFKDQAAFDEYVNGLRNATDGNKELHEAMIEVVQNAFPEFVQTAASVTAGAEKQASGIDYLIEKYKKLKTETGTPSDSSGTYLDNLIRSSETLQEVFAGMTIPEVLEFLADGDMGSAKDLTPYLDAVDDISKLQKQLTDAQKEMLDGGTLSSDTAVNIYTTLTNAGENYLDYLIVEGDQIRLNTEAYKEFIRQQVYERNGVADLTRALAEELALREQYADAMSAYDSGDPNELYHARAIQEQLKELEAEYGNIEELQSAIRQIEAIFNVGWEENGLKSGLEGLGVALDATETKATELENAIQSLKQNGNLDALTQTDFTNLLTQFPKLKRWLDAYSKGQISATKLTEVFQSTLDQFHVGNVFDDLSTAKDSISALGKVVNDLSGGDGVSFSTLSAVQEAFSGVEGIDDYIQKLKEAKTASEDISDIIGTLVYQALVDAAGSTQDLANADETLIASMLKEAGVADAAAVAHMAVARAKRDSSVASKVAAASTADDITAIYNECAALGMAKTAIYQVVATQVIFNNTKMDVSQKIAALNQLAQMCGVAISAIGGVSNATAGLGGVSSEDVSELAMRYIKSKRATSMLQAEQMAMSTLYTKQLRNSAQVSNPFSGVDFSSLGASSGGGGGAAKTKAEEIKSAFDALNSTMEHSIYLEQQYYNVADNEYDYDGMRQALQNQVGYYQQIQAAAESAMEQVRAYYRSQGMSDAVIEQQSEIQALQKAWWEAANSIDESLDKIATAIRDKLSKEIDDIQSAWSSLQKAAEEYSSTGVISIDSLQAIINAGVEYVALLKDENGQLVLNEEAVSSILEAKTQQLAVESALSYVEQVRNALMQNNVAELNRLLDVTSVTASSTWDLVYAQAALLNLNSDQYAQLINNINKFRSIATTTVQTVRKQVRNSVQNETKDYKSALDDVLKLVEDLIKYEHEQMVNALEDQRDA